MKVSKRVMAIGTRYKDKYGRKIGEEARHRYWKTASFGDEPPEYFWKDELYRAYFANAESGDE